MRPILFNLCLKQHVGMKKVQEKKIDLLKFMLKFEVM